MLADLAGLVFGYAKGEKEFVVGSGSPAPETLKETQPVQQVYAESLAYSEFIEKGTPVCFDLPAQPGTVVSALRFGGRLLVRQTTVTEDGISASMDMKQTAEE